DQPSIDVTATPPLASGAGQAVDIHFRNFIAPNPILDPVPNRTDLAHAPDEFFTVFKRGDAIKADAHITNVKGFAFLPRRDGSGKALDTKVIRLSFGAPGTIIRAYADLDFADDPTTPLP